MGWVISGVNIEQLDEQLAVCWRSCCYGGGTTTHVFEVERNVGHLVRFLGCTITRGERWFSTPTPRYWSGPSPGPKLCYLAQICGVGGWCEFPVSNQNNHFWLYINKHKNIFLPAWLFTSKVPLFDFVFLRSQRYDSKMLYKGRGLLPSQLFWTPCFGQS